MPDTPASTGLTDVIFDLRALAEGKGPTEVAAALGLLRRDVAAVLVALGHPGADAPALVPHDFLIRRLRRAGPAAGRQRQAAGVASLVFGSDDALEAVQELEVATDDVRSLLERAEDSALEPSEAAEALHALRGTLCEALGALGVRSSAAPDRHVDQGEPTALDAEAERVAQFARLPPAAALDATRAVARALAAPGGVLPAARALCANFRAGRRELLGLDDGDDEEEEDEEDDEAEEEAM